MGLHVGLNSSVALVAVDRGLVWAEQEERHSRIKNHCGFPEKALLAAKDQAARLGLSIDCVAVGGKTVFPHSMSRNDLLEAYTRVFDATVSGSAAVPDQGPARHGQRFVRERLNELLPGSHEVVAYDHHLCHAASAYHFLRKDDDPYLVVTLDGEGDDQSGTIWIGHSGSLDRIASSSRVASAGLLYFWVTYLMGLQPHEDEHKVMGLAGHVDPAFASQLGGQLFSRLLDVDDGTLELVVPGVPPSEWLGHLRQACHRVRFDHLAGAVQAFVENLASRLITAAVAKTQVPRVLLAGGVAMNVKLNRGLRALDCVEVLDVMPSAGDESLAIGAAFLGAESLNGKPLAPSTPTAFVGSWLDPDDLSNAIERAGCEGCRIIASGADATAAAGDVLLAAEPVAICVGRSEFGARALGHRSLVADPSSARAVAKLNAAIKRRDFWMPFAPAILDERAPDLLLDYDGNPSRWMMHAYEARKDERLRGAVHSTDWTCRPQMLEDTDRDPLAAILRHMAEQADLPAVVNTSLNQHGDPIVRTALEAVEILRRSPLRYLLLGDRLVEAPP